MRMYETHERVYFAILQEIKARLADGTLRAGCRLPPERACAEQFQVSRSAIREALRALELAGIVRCVHGEGNYLSDNVSECLIEPFSLMFLLAGQDPAYVQQLRRAIEPETARLAAIKRSEESARELFRICSAIEQSEEEVERAALDRQFHYLIAKEAQNPFILSILTAASRLIDSQIQRVREVILNDPRKSPAINVHHRAIAEAIAGQHEEDASRMMLAHMQMIDGYMSGMFEQ